MADLEWVQVAHASSTSVDLGWCVAPPSAPPGYGPVHSDKPLSPQMLKVCQLGLYLAAPLLKTPGSAPDRWPSSKWFMCILWSFFTSGCKQVNQQPTSCTWSRDTPNSTREICSSRWQISFLPNRLWVKRLALLKDQFLKKMLIKRANTRRLFLTKL